MTLASRGMNRLRELYGNILQNSRQHNQRGFNYPPRIHRESSAPLFEQLEPRVLLSVAPNLPGLHLIDPDVDNLQGQVIYLDFDGTEDVTYDGPVTVENIDIPAFTAPGELAGQEQAIISQVLDQLDDTFADTGLAFVTEKPSSDSPYSTIYIGGDNHAFSQYGNFQGIAETIDIGNQIKDDNAFVFSDCLPLDELAVNTAHEIGHLLGYAHADDETPGEDIRDYAQDYKQSLMSNENNPTYGSYSSSITIDKGSSHRFIVDGVWGTSESCHYKWYSSNSGTSGFLGSGTSYTVNNWIDPTISRTFNSTGSYVVRAEIWDRTWTGGIGEWWEAHRWYVTVVHDNLGPHGVGNLDLETSDDTGYRDYDEVTKKDNLDFDWDAPSDRGVSGVASGIKEYRYSLTDSTPDLNDSRTTSTSVRLNNVSDGSHTLYVRAYDNNNNPGDVRSISFTIDTSRPSSPTPSGPSGDISTLTPNITWNYNSSYDWKYDVDLEYKTITGIWWNVSGWEKTVTRTGSVQASGLEWGKEYRVRVLEYDIAGNSASNDSSWRYFQTIDPDPEAFRDSPTDGSLTLDYGESHMFRVRGEDDGGDLWKVEWTLSSAVLVNDVTDTDSTWFSGSVDTIEFLDYGDYTFDTAGDYTLRARVYDDSGDYDDAIWSIHVNEPPRPDLDVLSIDLDDTAPTWYIGDNIDAKVTVKNIGDADADGCKVLYYLGTATNKTYRYIGEGLLALGEIYPYDGMQPGEEESDWIGSLLPGGGWTIPENVVEGTYYIWVHATTSSDDSNTGNDWDKSRYFRVTQANHDPSIPSNIRVTDITQTTATVAWNPSTDPDSNPVSYVLQYQKDDLNPFWSSSYSTANTSYPLTGLDPNASYHVRVKALDNKGGDSGWSTRNNVFTTPPLNQPDFDLPIVGDQPYVGPVGLVGNGAAEQGIEYLPNHGWVTSSGSPLEDSALTWFDSNWNQTSQIIYEGFNYFELGGDNYNVEHIGDVAYGDGYIYAPLQLDLAWEADGNIEWEYIARFDLSGVLDTSWGIACSPSDGSISGVDYYDGMLYATEYVTSETQGEWSTAGIRRYNIGNTSQFEDFYLNIPYINGVAVQNVGGSPFVHLAFGGSMLDTNAPVGVGWGQEGEGAIAVLSLAELESHTSASVPAHITRSDYYTYLSSPHAEGLTFDGNGNLWVSRGKHVARLDSSAVRYSYPEIEIRGNNVVISDGDTNPRSGDHTDFGSVNAASDSLTRTFTIKNSGPGTLNLTGNPRVSISGSSNFTVIQQPSLSVSANGGTTTFKVKFDPSSSGTKTATVSIINNDRNENPYNFGIKGVGMAVDQKPDLTISDLSGVAGTYHPEDRITGSALIQNLGTVDVVDDFWFEGRLSTDKEWGNADDIVIYNYRETGGVDAGDAYYGYDFGIIPENTPSGSYYLAVMIDSTKVIDESDEADSSNIAWTSTASVVIPRQQTIFEVINFADGVHRQIGDFIGTVVGAAWDSITGYLDDKLEIAPNATVGFKMGLDVAGFAGEGAHVDIASAGIGMSVAYSLADETWTLARGISVDFVGDKFGLAGEEYIVLPIHSSSPVTVGLGLTGPYSLLAPPEVKLGINKAVSATVGIGGGIGTSLSVGIDTEMSQSQFLARTGQSSLGLAALDSFGLLSSNWAEYTLDNLGRLAEFGSPLLSALGVGDDPLALLSSGFLGGSDLHASVRQATSADMSLQLNAGIGAGLGVGVSATAYIGVFASADLEVLTVWEDDFSLAALTPPDDVGSDRVTAKTLSANTTYTHNLSPNDRDYFSFMSSGNQQHIFTINTGGAEKFVLAIYDSQGSIMERHTLSNVAGGTIVFDATDSDQYFIALEGGRGTQSGDYSLAWQPAQNNGGFNSGLLGYQTDGYVCLVDRGSSNYSARLEEHSPASLKSEVVIPDLNGQLTFDYRLTSVGDGDTLDVLIGDTVVHSIPIDAIQQDFTQVGPIDLSAYAGQTVELTFLLNSVGAANAAFEVDNILVEGNDSYTFYSPYGDGTVTVVNTRDQEIGGINDHMDVRFKSDDSVSSIKFMGEGMPEGLGIVIANASSVGSIKDSRKGDPADIAFIASDSAIKAVSLKSGLGGYDLNGLTLGGVTFAADMDSDGNTDDETSIWGTHVSSIKVADIAGDIVLPGTGAVKGVKIKAGQLYASTDIVLGSYLKSLTATQWVGGSLITPWAKSIAIKGDRRNGIAGDFGADLTFTGGDPKKGVALRKLSVAGTITDSIITANFGSVGNITAARWDNGSLNTTWIKNLTTKGSRANAMYDIPALAGDFGATLNLSGQDTRGISLNKLKVAGSILDSHISLAGAAGTIMAAQWDGGSLNATWAKTVMTKGNRRDPAITGDFDATLNLTGQDSRGISLNKLKVAGSILDSHISLAGAAGTIMAAQWDGGSLNATWAKTVMTKGNRRDPAITGDFEATLNLTGQNTRGISLNKLKVAGTITDSIIKADVGSIGSIKVARTVLNSEVRTAGSMGSITLGATDGSNFLAGIADTVDEHASETTDFVNLDAVIKSVNIKGWKPSKGEFAPVRLFVDSNFSAASIGTAKLLNIRYDKSNNQFGFFALDQGTGKEIKSISSRDTETGENWKWPNEPQGDEIDFEIRII